MIFLSVEPPTFELHNIPITNKPTKVNFQIKNTGQSTVQIDFNEASSDKFWFTARNELIDGQQATGFNIFFSAEKLETVILDPDQEEEYCFVILTSHYASNYPSAISIPIKEIQEYGELNEIERFQQDQQNQQQLYFLEIPLSLSFTEISFKVSPRNLFLNDCCKDQLQTKVFMIKNRCNVKLPIMIYPPDGITISTPVLKNFIEIDPNDTVSLSLSHTPTEIGQFNHKIQFDCILTSTVDTQIMKLMTSVSPPEIPPDFPLITPESSLIDFGEVHAGVQTCESFTITNPGETVYDVSVVGVLDIFLNSGDGNQNNTNFNSNFFTNTTSNANSNFNSNFNSNINFNSNANNNMNNNAMSFTNANGSNSLVLNSTNAPSQISFRSATSSVSQSRLFIKLQPHSGITIFVEYTPAFHLGADTENFEHRTFMIALTFVDSSLNNNENDKNDPNFNLYNTSSGNNSNGYCYFRRIKCKSAICHSTITVMPTTIDFGDTIVGRSDQTSTITITNPSPMPTTVRISPSSRSLVVPPGPIEVPARSSTQFTLTFYPKKINPDYLSTIVFKNENNASNDVHISVSAIVVAAASESLHSMAYTLFCDNSNVSSFNFSNCASNFPNIKSFYIKNRTNNSLKLKLHSTSDEIKFYQESSSLLVESNSSGNVSNSSLSNNPTNNNTLNTVNSTGNTNVSNNVNNNNNNNNDSIINENNSFNLLTEDSVVTSLVQIEKLMKINSSFFTNLFTLSTQFSEDAIINHFDILQQRLSALLSNNTENVALLNDTEIEIPPLCRQEVFIILTPNHDALLWKHRVEKLEIDLLYPTQQQTIVKPLEIPIIFNEAKSTTFLSSHSLYFGTIQRNNVYQRKIYLINESALPLLYSFNSETITFEKKRCGIVLPFSSISAPFSLCPKIDGEMHEKIVVRNILNPQEDQEIRLRGTVFRRSNFIVDPIVLDFGDVFAGQSSQKILVFITNTSNSENEFTFLHVKKESYHCKPLMTYQFKNSNSSRLNESIRFQIEKLEQKLRCLQRKNKTMYALQVQHLLDNLSQQKQNSSNAQLKYMDAKYMDRVTFHTAPLQMVCIEFQMIPSTASGKRLSAATVIEGAVLVYERGKSETQKTIHYSANVIPQTQRLLEAASSLEKSIQIEPTSINLEHILVQNLKSINIKLKNVSNSTQNYWISSDSTRDCIISSPKNEGSIKPNETHEIRIDIFCIFPGIKKKSITITTQSSTHTIPFVIQAEYQRLLSFPGLRDEEEKKEEKEGEKTTKENEVMMIDFGNIPLTSLQIVEQRSSFSIFNTSENPLYVRISNDDEGDILIYEQDPKEPQNLPFLLDSKSSVIMNVLMQPEIDSVPYYRYITKRVDATLTIKTFETQEEAEDDSLACLSKDIIKVTSKIGRIGINLSETIVDFGTVKKETIEANVIVKNRSTYIPLEVLTTCSQGLVCNPSVFTIEGKKVGENNTKELTLRFTPSAEGVNEAKLLLTANGVQSYTKSINITAFVDPGIIKTDLPMNEKKTDVINIGELYVNNGKLVAKPVSVKLTNASNIAISIEFCNQRLNIGSKRTQTARFNFPFQDFVYKPEEPKFSYRLSCKSLTTQRILKIIDICGEFVVSNGVLSTENISLGRFGKFNNFTYEEQNFSIINKSNIPLVLKTFCKPPLLKIQHQEQNEQNEQQQQQQDSLITIEPNEKKKFMIIPDIEKLQKEELEGTKTVVLSFNNQYNIQNVMKATVTFDVLSSMLQFGRTVVENDANLVVMNKFTKLLIPDEESETGTIETFTANSWFTISNRQNDECSVLIETELLLPDLISIDVFLRKSEVKIAEIDLQSGETAEIRQKANLKKPKSFDVSTEYRFANLVFKPEGAEEVSIQVIYRP